MRRRGECPTLDKIQNTESFVQIRVQLAVGGRKRQNGGVPGGWGLFRLKFTRGTPSRQALRSAKPIQMFGLGYCQTFDMMLRILKLLVQNSDDVWLGFMQLKGGVRWGLTRGDLEGRWVKAVS